MGLRARLGALSLAAIAAVAGSSTAGGAGTAVRTAIGPARLLSAGFGYAVTYRTVEHGIDVRTRIRLLVFDHGRWRNATPPMLKADGINAIEDVDFVDPRHGWVAAYNCATVAVHVYRTSDGGRTWRSLGKPGDHSCGGGPTYLSFADLRHGWLEPVSPNAPGGDLYRTLDAGRTWRRIATDFGGLMRPPGLPCLAPVRFTSAVKGWMARCAFSSGIFTTGDGGRRWRAVRVPVQARANARFDLPAFFAGSGVEAATIGTQPPAKAGRMRVVTFSVSSDGGRTWAVRSTRTVAACALEPYFTSAWPASIAGARTWWVVEGTTAQVTTDAGRAWRTVVAQGLPGGCSVLSVSAAGPETAWAVAREGTSGSALFRTADGGRHWRRVNL